MTTPKMKPQLKSLERANNKQSSNGLNESFNYTFDSRYSKNFSSPRVPPELISYNVPSSNFSSQQNSP